MTIILTLMIYFLIGLFAGLGSGVFGIGGGSVRIPLLNVAGLPLLSAFGINLLVIPFSSATGAISQRRNVDRAVALRMALGGTVGGLTGAFMAGLIRPLALAVIFVTVSVISVVGIYLDRIAPGVSFGLNTTTPNIVFGTMFLNLLTGMRGGSGGSLFPPFLRALKFDMHRAIATSLSVTVFTASAAMFVYWHRGNILWLPAILVLSGSMLGAQLGSRISMKTKPMWLEKGLSILVLGLAALTIIKAL